MLFLSFLTSVLLLPAASLAASPWATPQPRALSRWTPREPSTFRPLSQRVPMKARASPVPVNWKRDEPTTGDYVVRNVGNQPGQYATIQAAVDALAPVKAGGRIFVCPGIYKEQVLVKNAKGPISIQGSTPDASSYASNQVTISFNALASNAGSNDASATFRASQANFKLYNLNIENTYGHTAPGCQCQAVALSTQGSGQQGFYGVRLSGYQDTLLANKGTQIFAKSAISGAVDFIFGQYAPTYIWNSDIISVSKGAITAPGGATVDAGQIFVFDNSRIIASADAAANTSGAADLGRPWKEYGKSVYLNSYIGPHVSKAGWTIWTASAPNTANSILAEYKNTGPGNYENNAGTRASFAKKLTDAQALDYTIDKVLGSDYTSWVDSAYLNYSIKTNAADFNVITESNANGDVDEEVDPESESQAGDETSSSPEGLVDYLTKDPVRTTLLVLLIVSLLFNLLSLVHGGGSGRVDEMVQGRAWKGGGGSQGYGEAGD
ncbi:pectin lyase fold/virulence factor [Mrakia frigida]|uniref:pectin lyase fold/virulence factor n=1 Tax=Mrakia frigida TaxID=29902 RepID=UPI003FCC0FF8